MDLRDAMRRVIVRLGALRGDEPADLDPIDHPDLRRMSLAQLADIPFDPYARDHHPIAPDRSFGTRRPLRPWRER